MENNISKDRVIKIGCKIFRCLGVNSIYYRPLLKALVETSLRGVDSHGIRLIPHYARAIKIGRIKINPKFTIKKTSTTTLILNADDGLGICAGIKAMEAAILMAKKYGTGIVVVKNSSHFGAAGIYGLMAAKKNMIGQAFTSVDSLVVPYGGRKPFLGTNAYCFTAPMSGEEPFCLDMATTVISWNKLIMYRKQNIKLPKGVAVDIDGNETLNPQAAVALTHFGNYKGYGIALMIEIMTSLLSGMPYGPKISKMYPLDSNKRKLSHFFMAIDIKKFQSVSKFKKRMKQMADDLRAIYPTKGYSEVMVAGDPEKKIYMDRIKNGIPLTMEIEESFSSLAKELNIKIDL